MLGPEEYQFVEASSFSSEYKNTSLGCQNENLTKTWGNYCSLMDRIHSQGILPIQLVYLSGLFASFKITALRRAQEEGHKPPFDGPVAWEYQKAMWDKWRNGSMSEAELDRLSMKDGSNNLNGLLSVSSDKVKEGVEAVLASMLSDSWTAFEILSADLWKECVNCRPDYFIDRLAKGKQIDIDRLKEYNFNLQNCLGTLLIDSGKYQFDSLGKILDAYTPAFNLPKEQNGRAIFSPYATLNAISQVRNCFAHRGGFIDRRALNSISRVRGLETAQVNTRIELTGPIVRDCITTLVEQSLLLIKFIDSWMCNNAKGHRNYN